MDLLLIALVLVMLVVVPTRARAADRRYYTEEKLAVARQNLDRFVWAKTQRDEILAKADRWAAYEDDRLAQLVIPPEVPRAYQIHNFECPVHGLAVQEHGLYSWGIDFDRPFKVTCPVGGEAYPSNDFQAYLDSGMKDRSLLTGDHPDDGWGWHDPKDPENINYWFVAYYAHWSMMRWLMEAVENLGTAAMLAEPERARVYAHKCALLLWRISEHYPDYAYERQGRESREHNPDYTGKMFNMIWETRPPHTFALAYDAVRPFLAGDRDLEAAAGRSGDEVARRIEQRVLMEAAACITTGNGRIRGNYGMHQKTLLTLAQVLEGVEGPVSSREMVDYVLANPHLVRDTDMGLRDALENIVYRDGLPHESLGYNRIWVSQIADLADDLTVWGHDFFRHPRFRRLLTWPFEVMVCGKFTPPTGDTGDMFGHGGMWDARVCQLALQRLDDPRMTWVLQQEGGGRQDLFEAPAEVPKGEAATPEIGLRSVHFPAYRMVNLQAGNEANRTALSFFYGDHTAHMHRDQLNILIFGHDNALLTDIGYPEQTDSFNHRLAGFFTNTIAHNTVVVDARKQSRGPGRLHGLVAEGFCQFVDASCEGAYPGTVTRYRRACMTVEAAPDRAYVFDAFYVAGGSQHDFSLHGNQADFACSPALGPARTQGTLAGPDVPYEQFYDDPELRDKPLGTVRCSGYTGSGFQFLRNVQEAALKGAAVVDWRLTEPLEGQPERPWEGIGLRAHVLGAGETLIACDGPVQKYRYLPRSVKFLIRRREGTDLSSRFLTVFEPYRGETWITSVTSLTTGPSDGAWSAVKVTLSNGEVHYLYHSLDPEQERTLEGGMAVRGQAACVIVGSGGEVARAVLVNGRRLTFGGMELTGRGTARSRIASIDYPSGTIELTDPVLDGEVAVGSPVLISPEGFADCVTVRRVSGPTRFSIGDEDLQAAGGPVTEVRAGENRLVTTARNPHARVGMTVLNSLGEPQGRLAEATEDGWVLDRGDMGALSEASFPKASGDLTARYRVVVAGPGDAVRVPSVVRYDRKARSAAD